MTRAPIPGLEPGERRLDGALAHYLGRVLRLQAGDTFVAFDPAIARESDAVVVWTDNEVVTVRFGLLREATAPSGRAVTLVQGLAKGDKCDAIVRDATELGVTRVVVARTHRSVVKLDAARAMERQARWARIAQEAARQSGRADTPAIDLPCSWGEALKRLSDGARFCLWEGAANPLAPPLFEALTHDAALAFACGPEGGFESREVDEARDRGWVVVSLGPLTLRTETVAAAVLGAVRVWQGLGKR